MKLFRFAMLLLVQLSPIFVHVNGEAVPEYKCNKEEIKGVVVKDASAQLTKGCVIKDVEIAFDLKAMYEAAAKKNPKATAVVIGITEAVFIDSHIMLFNADGIPGDINTQVPLQFTMSKCNIKGSTKLEFGIEDSPIKLPPYSRIRIADSELAISTTETNHNIFTFHGLQLVTGSSLEISSNVITMAHEGYSNIAVFVSNGPMIISGKSSFTVQSNNITLTGHKGTNCYHYVWYTSQNSPLTITESSIYTWKSNNISIVGYEFTEKLMQYVWAQSDKSPLEITKNSIFTWTSNIIRMVGYKVTKMINQYVWFQNANSFLKISNSGTYTWESNIIGMLGYEVKNDGLDQNIWFQDSTSALTTDGSNYTWLSNTLSIDGYDFSKILQYVWYSYSPITISTAAHLLFETNKMLLLAKDSVTTTALKSYVMWINVISVKPISGTTISGGSSMIWKDNCMGMAHKKTDKRHVLGFTVDITDKSRLMWTGNYITTTNEYKPSDGNEITKIVWGRWATPITIEDSILTIGETQVYANGATGSMRWDSLLSTSKKTESPTMVWSSSPAKDGRGSPIPTLNYSNIRDYICPGRKHEPNTPIHDPTNTAKGKSASAISSTIPAVLITSVVFIYLYNW